MDNIIIDFSKYSFCFRGVIYKDFTNYLKDFDEFIDHFQYLIEKFLPFFAQQTPNNLYYASKHCHLIRKEQNSDKYDLILNIVRTMLTESNGMDFETFLYNNLNDYPIWQLGLSGGVRIIGTLNNNIFSVLFFDYNHLIYPDKNYNQQDVSKNTFSPM